MRFYSNIKEGLYFDKHQNINEELIKRINTFLKAEDFNNVYQTLEWLVVSKEHDNGMQGVIITGSINNKIVYFLPLQRLFLFTNLFLTYINPIFSDYTSLFSREK